MLQKTFDDIDKEFDIKVANSFECEPITNADLL